MKLRRFAVLTVVVGLLHGGLIIASELVVFKNGFDLDHPEIEPSRLRQAFAALLPVLMQPGEMIWAALRITPRSSLLEWSMIVLNSLVWGATVAVIVGLLSHRKRSPEAVSN